MRSTGSDREVTGPVHPVKTGAVVVGPRPVAGHTPRASLSTQGACKFPPILQTPLARGGLYITTVWIRRAKELHMKRLRGLVLVMARDR